MYAHVVNGAVAEIFNSLPQTFANTSNFNLLTDAELANFSVFPVTESNPTFNSNTQNRTGVSYAVSGNTVTATYTYTDKTAADVQPGLCAAIDALADTVSLKYVTGGYTQGARYQRKLEQANAYKSASYPNSATPSTIDATLYPYIMNEAVQTGQTGQQVADGVISNASQWDGLGGKIEGFRIGGKKNINAATTAADAYTAYNTAVTNLNGC